MKAISLFAGAGIGEFYLEDLDVEILLANELLPNRSTLYSKFYQNPIVTGDIRLNSTKDEILNKIGDSVDLIIATPPCQGVSSLGKNKLSESFVDDERNFLIDEIIYFIEELKPSAVLIENVTRYLNMTFPIGDEFVSIIEYLKIKLSKEYFIEYKILNAKDFEVPQMRPRSFIKIFKSNVNWPWPKEHSEVLLSQSIAHLPSLMPGETSDINYHFAKEQRYDITLFLQHTPTGQSALKNPVFFPKNKKGVKVSGFHNTYKRMKWEMPAHARTTYCNSVSSHNNIHPGTLLPSGLYSNPRVLTFLETLIVSSIPTNIVVEGKEINEMFKVIGEGVPPKLMYNVLKTLKINANSK